MISINPNLEKSHPRVVYGGLTQGQLGSIPFEPTPLPQHLVHSYFFSERGTGKPTITRSDDFKTRYGDSTLSEGSPYYNHATDMLNVFLKKGQTVLSERLIPPDATKAFLRLSLEIIPTEIPLYERNPDGTVVYTVDGVTGINTPVVDSTALGWRLVWHSSVSMYPSANGSDTYGKAGGGIDHRLGDAVSSFDPTLKLGEVDSTPTQSRIYAILDQEITDFGKYGDSIGIKVRALSSTTVPEINLNLMNSIQAMPYYLQCVEIKPNDLLARPIATADSDEAVYMVLKENVVHPTYNTPLSYQDAFIKAYGDPNAISAAPGPFGRLHVYQDNLNEILTKLVDGEEIAGVGTILGEKDYKTQYESFNGDVDYTDPTNRHLLNILTGYDHNDIPMFGFDVRNSSAFGGLSFEDNEVIYASGGSDGLVLDTNGIPDRKQNLRLLDELVRGKMLDYGVTGANLLNIARYPAQIYYDSGFSYQTKLAMMGITKLRKDIVVVTGLKTVCDYVPTGPTETSWEYTPIMDEEAKRSMASQLYSNAQMIPESMIDGTDSCRIVIVRGDSPPFNPAVPYRLPFTFDVANKAANYWGNSSGNWDGRYAFDREEIKSVTYVGDIDDTHELTEMQAERMWELGTCYPLYSDDRTLFWPMLRTVHRESTSPMVSFEFVFGCCTAVKEAYRVWVELVGSNLEEAQFIERSNTKIANRLNSNVRFAGKFEIEVVTEITAADRNRRYSWTTTIYFRSGPYRTVNKLRIVGETSQFTATTT